MHMTCTLEVQVGFLILQNLPQTLKTFRNIKQTTLQTNNKKSWIKQIHCSIDCQPTQYFNVSRLQILYRGYCSTYSTQTGQALINYFLELQKSWKCIYSPYQKPKRSSQVKYLHLSAYCRIVNYYYFTAKQYLTKKLIIRHLGTLLLNQPRYYSM